MTNNNSTVRVPRRKRKSSRKGFYMTAANFYKNIPILARKLPIGFYSERM